MCGGRFNAVHHGAFLRASTQIIQLVRHDLRECSASAVMRLEVSDLLFVVVTGGV